MASEPARILVVEDDPGIGPRLVAGLLRAGFDAVLAADGHAAAAQVAATSFDLIVLDLMLPGIDGPTLLEQWRFRTSVPIIVLTADTRLDTRLASFRAGAVDYLPKPFFVEELLVRIQARLGVADVQPPSPMVSLGEARLDLGARVVTVDGAEVALTAHEVNLLEALVTHKGRAFTRQQLADAALPADGRRQARTVDSHVSHLRKKLPDAARSLKTVYGVGYRWTDR